MPNPKMICQPGLKLSMMTFRCVNYFPANPPGFPNIYGYQFWNGEAWGFQNTSLLIDIVDDHNQFGRPYFFFPDGNVNDQVQDYSLPFIERNILRNIYGLQSLTDELKSFRPATVSDDQIDLLISNF